MFKSLYAVSWVVGLLLAPHSLTLLGNLAGANQSFFFIWLAMAAGLYWINARSAFQMAGASELSYQGANSTPLMMLLLTSRIVATIALSTVLLVTAGFVFNETFVFWFPNFAFAFILLGVVLAVHLWGGVVAEYFQIGLAAVVLVGLVSLIAAGLWGYNGQEEAGVDISGRVHPHGIASALLLFVGFDLGLNPFRPRQGLEARTIHWTLMAIALVFGLWAVVGLLYVPAAKLSDSFIPHLLAARYVQGETGRTIMGAVVIAGSVAAVNGLFKSLAELSSGFAARWRPVSGKKWPTMLERSAVWTILTAAAVGLMMAGGVAGTEEIDIYIQAGFIFWIFYYGGMNLSVLMDNRSRSPQLSRLGWGFPAVGAVTMGLAGVVLLVADPNGGAVFKTFLKLGLWAMLVLFGGVVLRRVFNIDTKWKYDRQK